MPPDELKALEQALGNLRTALRDALAAIGDLDRAERRVIEVGAVLHAIETETEALLAARLGAIATLRREHSYDRIAVLTGLSKARVAQLSRAAESGQADQN